MSYLRFTPRDYEILAGRWHSLGLDACPAHAWKRLLVESLAGTLPELAKRAARFRSRDLRLLGNHFRARRPLDQGHDLTAIELGILAEAAGSLLLSARFVQPLRRKLVQEFRETHPEVATKLDRMSLRQFERLCAQARP